MFFLSISWVSNPQMVNMVKNMIKQFENMQAEVFESDELIPGANAFPLNAKIDKPLYKVSLENPEDMFSINDLNSGFVEIDGKEYPQNNFSLEYTYTSLPYFQCINSWYENISIHDLKGKDMLLKDKELEKYREIGLIEDEFNYPYPGMHSEKFWLNREPEWEEKLKFTGKIMLEYPAEYDITVFTRSDTSEWKTVGDVKWKLVDIEKNMAILLLNGDRRKVEGVKIILLNKENKPFGSTSSVSIDAELYNTSTKKVKILSDEEIQASIDKFSTTGMMVKQVRKIKVYGNIDKVILLKTKEVDMLEQEFEVTLEMGF